MGRATRQEWVKRIERWRDSGLTAKEFAAEIDVTPTSLSYWKWKLRQESNAPAAAPPGLVTKHCAPRAARSVPAPRFLELVSHPSAQVGDVALLEVVLRSGVVVRVPDQFDESALRRVVTLLGGT
jgi:transposase